MSRAPPPTTAAAAPCRRNGRANAATMLAEYQIEIARNQRGGRSRGEGKNREAIIPSLPAPLGRQPPAGVGAASTQAQSSPTEARGGAEGAGAGAEGALPQFGPWQGDCAGWERRAGVAECEPSSKGRGGIPSEGRRVVQSAAARGAGRHAASAMASAAPTHHSRLACAIIAVGDHWDYG